jgi:hypothetical protein
MLTFGLAVALLVSFLLIAGRHNELAVQRDWEFVLNPEGHRLYSDTVDEILRDRGVTEQMYEDAFKARGDGQTEKAIRFLETGSLVVAGYYSQSLLELLRNVGHLASAAAAIAPLPPLRPAGFEARELATLAGLQRFVHHLLLTTRDRLAFRLAVLRCSVRAAVGLLLRTTSKTRSEPEADRHWRRLSALRTDLGTLTDEALLSLRSVLASLAAVRRPAVAEVKKTA